MKVRDVFWIVGALAFSGTGIEALAYESSPRTDVSNVCAQVIFTDFKPKPYSYDTNNAEVKPQSDFSFFASKAADPRSIKVTVKGEQVRIDVKPQSNGSLVIGKLPAAANGGYVRVEIAAQGPNRCDRSDGWLLKVAK